MDFDLQEAMAYYKKQGAPGDQTALRGLLKEIQQANGGAIPGWTLGTIAAEYSVKETFLRAIVRRIPSLRLEDSHLLELCSGPNCGRHTALAALAEQLHKENPGLFSFRYTRCMGLCRQGPNLRWDGQVYTGADSELIRMLVNSCKK